MRFEVLGPVRVLHEGLEVELGGPQQRLVLTLLAISRGRVASIDQLVDAIWTDPPANARKAVQVHISALRKALGDSKAIETVGGGYRLAADDSDLIDFDNLLDQGRMLLATDPNQAAIQLTTALGLWRGVPFGALHYEAALQTEITRLEERHLAGLEDRIDAEVAAGRFPVAEIQTLLDDHPLRERIRALHMTALYRAGRHSEALLSYQDYAKGLIEERGLDPSPELQQLELRILNHDPTLGPTLPATTPTVRSTPPPTRYASFCGRTDEMASIREAIQHHRLTTISGPGGIGKSSLAAEAVLALADERPIVWVDVERTEPGDLSRSVALAMGLQPGPSIDTESLILTYAQDRSDLLVLDGCEPNIQEVTDFVDRILGACHSISIVTTSRQPLHLPGEHIIRVGPLAPIDARQLFCDRTERPPDTLQVDEICDALDHMPLAIELAAARLGTVPLTTLENHLDDQPNLLKADTAKRQGSLAAVLEFSYQHLEPGAQQAFRRLSVFKHFEPETASLLTDQPNHLDILTALVDASLVQPHNEHREYRMLEPIRQYGKGLLSPAELSKAERLHTLAIADLCSRISESLRSPHVANARVWLSRRRSDIAAGITTGIGRGDENGVQALAAVGRELANLGFGVVLEPAARLLLDRNDLVPSHDLAVAMANAAHVLEIGVDLSGATRLAERAEEVAKATGDRRALAVASMRHAVTLSFNKETVVGLELCEEAITQLEATGTPEFEEYYNAAVLALRAGQFETANDYAMRGASREHSVFQKTLGNFEEIFATLAFLEGHLDSAIELTRQSIEVRTLNASYLRASQGWWLLADYLTLADRYEEAYEAILAADRVAGLVGPISPSENAVPRMRIAAASGDFQGVLDAALPLMGIASSVPLDRGLPDLDTFLAGDSSGPPTLVEMLRPLAEACFEAGDTDIASRLAHSASHLMSESRFDRWSQTGEPDRWTRLVAQCGPAPPFFIPLTPREALAEAMEIVGMESH